MKKASEMMDYTIRQYKETDLNRIYSDWLRSYKQHGTMLKDVSDKVYFDGHRKLITKLIDNGDVVVLADNKDDYVIAGFACYNADVLHFIYVKKYFRRFKLATELMDYAGFARGCDLKVTHYVGSYAPMQFLRNYNTIYNPYLSFDL